MDELEGHTKEFDILPGSNGKLGQEFKPGYHNIMFYNRALIVVSNMDRGQVKWEASISPNNPRESLGRTAIGQ